MNSTDSTHFKGTELHRVILLLCVAFFLLDGDLCVLSYPVAAWTLHHFPFPPSFHSTLLWILRALTWRVTEDRQKPLRLWQYLPWGFEFYRRTCLYSKSYLSSLQTVQNGCLDFLQVMLTLQTPCILQFGLWFGNYSTELNIVTSLSCELVLLLSKIKIFLQIRGTPELLWRSR